MQQLVIIILLILSFIISLIIALLVLFANKRSLNNIFLSTSIMLASLWGICIYLTLITNSLFIGRLSFFFGSLIPLSLILFVYSFTKQLANKQKLIIFLTIPSCIIAVLSTYDNLLFSAISVREGYIQILSSGWLLNIYYLYFSIYILFLLYLFFISSKLLTGIKKIQLRFIGFGVLITIILGSFVNLFLPSFGIYNFNSLGPVFTLFMSGSMLYAATKHHLLDMRIIFSEVWATSLVLIVLILFLANPSLFNFMLLLMVSATSALFVRSTLSESMMNSELKHANHQLEKDKKELVELDRMKDEFLQMATHELNTPISVIQGRLNMGIEENMCKLNTQQKSFFRPVLLEMNRLANLSKDILNVTRIDQNRLKLNQTPSNLEELISTIISSFKLKSKEKNNTILLAKSSNDLQPFYFDQSKIGEVVSNLISNANKFTENGKITVNITSKQDMIIVSVADNGVGIPKKDQDHIFEKFYQAGRFDEESPQEQQGSGLGLYISKSIIEQHGGKIWFESTKGNGSTFYFSLPYKKQTS